MRYVKEGADRFLRVYIDKPEGIDINDCENVSRAINGPLDELDPIEEAYCLEVCSPELSVSLSVTNILCSSSVLILWLRCSAPLTA